ncbi:MAG TPA: alkaline phosphatase family protein [Baekduia sp.]|nr:alkaline phosphatase family protein [Baekduia sp.]
MGERWQLALLALLSGLATAAVLAGGVGASGQSPEVTAALNVARTTTVALPAAEPAATTDEDEDAEPPETPDDSTADEPAAASPSDDDETPAETTAPDDSADNEGAAPQADDKASKKEEPAADEPRPTHVKHVFEIVLAGRGFDATFGAGSVATYLNGTLRPKGTLLTGARSLGRADLPDHLALISGQPPNDDTRAGCPTYTEIPQTAKPDKAGEITAKGCAYPNTIITVADQVAASGRTWRAYVEDLDKGQPPRTSCRRPASGAADDTVVARPGDGYATRHNPFVYFHSLLDLSGCDSSDGPLAPLETDLAKAKTTPAFSYIVPNLCNDGTTSPCPDGSPGGLAAADAFLATWVPRILASPAYADGGLLLVTFAGGAAAPEGAEAPARNGALVVSRFATAGATDDTAIDPYGLLRTVQDVLGLKPLARSADATSLLDTVLAAARIPRPGDD